MADVVYGEPDNMALGWVSLRTNETYISAQIALPLEIMMYMSQAQRVTIWDKDYFRVTLILMEMDIVISS